MNVCTCVLNSMQDVHFKKNTDCFLLFLFIPLCQQLLRYRPAVTDMCNAFEDVLARFIKTFEKNEDVAKKEFTAPEEGVQHETKPKRRRRAVSSEDEVLNQKDKA